MDGWDRFRARRGRLGELAAAMLIRRGVRRGRRIRRAVPALHPRVRHRRSAPGARPDGAVHPGGGGNPRGGRVNRWRPSAAPHGGNAFAAPVPLLREARAGWRTATLPVARLTLPHSHGAHLADREAPTLRNFDERLNRAGRARPRDERSRPRTLHRGQHLRRSADDGSMGQHGQGDGSQRRPGRDRDPRVGVRARWCASENGAAWQMAEASTPGHSSVPGRSSRPEAH